MTHTTKALLAFLLLQRHHSHSRELLAGLFWGERQPQQAHGCLSTALWRLRRALEPEGVPRGTYLTVIPTGEVSFNCQSQYWLDVAAFEKQVRQVLSTPIPCMETLDAQRLEKAQQYYSGDLLEGFYDDWILQDRERLRALYLNTLAHLMRYYAHHGAYLESLGYGLQILHCDPLREEVHREVMRLYLKGGQRALAVKQYETCREVLATELGINPMEETQALYAQVAAEACDEVPVTSVGECAGLQQALQQIRLALRNLNEAREQLGQAAQLVERFVHSPTR